MVAAQGADVGLRRFPVERDGEARGGKRREFGWMAGVGIREMNGIVELEANGDKWRVISQRQVHASKTPTDPIDAH